MIIDDSHPSDYLGWTAVDRMLDSLRWCPASDHDLRSSESRLLGFLRTPYELRRISIGPPPDVKRQAGQKTEESEPSIIPLWSASWAGPWYTTASESSSQDDGSECFINTLVLGEQRPPSGNALWQEEKDSDGSQAGPNIDRLYSFTGGIFHRMYAKAQAGVGPSSAAPEAQEGPIRPSKWVSLGRGSTKCSPVVCPAPANGDSKWASFHPGATKGAPVVCPDPAKPNLVMVHGYAACLGFFFRNFDALSEHFNVYAVDQLGWGASSRPTFTPTTSQEAETWFVEALEAWRRGMKLERFVLWGHSFGGYICARYMLKYPERVQQLVLVGPAGFNHVSEKMRRFRQTWKGFVFDCIWETNTTPQAVLRLLGPWSEEWVKSASTQRWSDLPEGQESMTAEQVEAFSDYIFQTLSAPESGELCMKHIFSLGAFARRPLVDHAFEWKAPTAFIYGQDDIMDYRAGLGAAKRMPVPAEVLLIQQAGHMLFLEKPTTFNQAVIHACRDILPPSSKAVAAATKAVQQYIVPLHQCHTLPTDLDSTSDLFAAQGTGKSGVRRLASGWGIG